MLPWFPGFAFFLWLVRNVQATTVITVDDQDPSIIYAPALSSWTKVDGPGMDAGGTHMVSSDSAATATLTRKFLNAHFWSPLWPYRVTTDISIDGSNNFTINLQDPNAPEQPSGGSATVASSIMLSYASTVMQEHTIVLSMHPGDLYVVLDQFTFDVEDDSIANVTTSLLIPGSTAAPSSEFSTTPSPPSTTPQSSDATSTDSESSITSSVPWEATTTPQSSDATSTKLDNALGKKSSSSLIIIVVVAVALVLAIVGLIVFIVCRRRRRHKPSRFLSENPFDWRYKRQASRDSVTSDLSDTNWTQVPAMRQANLSSSPVSTHSAHRSDGATDEGQNTTPRADSSVYQATRVPAPVKALRIMNNARSRHYPSGITLVTPLPDRAASKRMPEPLHRAANMSSFGYESKGSVDAEMDDSACWKSYGDSKAPKLDDEQWLTKKSQERQPSLYSPIPPPPYRASETMALDVTHQGSGYPQPLKFRSIT